MATSPSTYKVDDPEYKLTPEMQTKIDELVSKFPEKNSALMPALYIIQDEFGWIPPAAISQLAEILDTTPNKIYSVVTFYTMYNEKPVGKYHIQVCRNVSCSLMGAKHIVDHLSEKLNIQPGETTEDKKYTLSLVECLGACGSAPVMMINDTYYENLTVKKVDNILESLQ
ncbi:NADH-quinone oxidoreductase subunit NuoE [candidate division KSB1 bacterium]|nr:NADH-quinone oxidoreductase subunit NuoE [candidate division KSB1 bacterium]